MFYHILSKDPEKDVYIVYLCGPDVNFLLVVVVEVVKVLVDVIPVVDVSTNNVNNTMMN